MASEVPQIVGEDAEGHIILRAMVVGGSHKNELPQMQKMIDGELQKDLLKVSVSLRIGICVNEDEGIVGHWSD